MLLNLLSNAAKFTEKGAIYLKIDPQTHPDGDWIIVGVTDDGIHGPWKKLVGHEDD